MGIHSPIDQSLPSVKTCRGASNNLDWLVKTGKRVAEMRKQTWMRNRQQNRQASHLFGHDIGKELVARQEAADLVVLLQHLQRQRQHAPAASDPQVSAMAFVFSIKQNSHR